MILAGDFKKNSTKILHKGEPWVVLDFMSVKPGKGGALIKTKLKSLKSGTIYEETFRSGEKLKEPDLETKKMQFLYSDDLYHFMDQDTFDQVSFSQALVKPVKGYLKSEEVFQAIIFEGNLISLEPPMFINLKVEETEPGVRGNSAQGGVTKPAKLETGLTIQVPLFVCQDDVIKVDTREDKYIERVVA